MGAGGQLARRAVDVRHAAGHRRLLRIHAGDDGRDVLPPAMYAFMAPRGSEWDAPVDRRGVHRAADPRTRRLRPARAAHRQACSSIPRPNARPVSNWDLGVGTWELTSSEAAAIGSNNFAVSGRLTADGGALVANDMHLTIRVPNTWYRAALEWPDPSNPDEPQPPDRRHAAWRPGGRRRQQHARRVGIYQYLRRLERHRPARCRSRAGRAGT